MALTLNKTSSLHSMCMNRQSKINGLKEKILKEWNKYIIDMTCSLSPPSYIRQVVRYDFKLYAKPIMNELLECQNQYDFDMSYETDYYGDTLHIIFYE